KKSLDVGSVRRWSQGSTAEHEDWRRAVGPGRKWQDHFVGVTAHDNDIDCLEKRFISVVSFSTTTRQEVERAVETRNEAVDTCANEYGSSHSVSCSPNQ